MTRVAVIGGGWAGMAAAVELAERGVPVTVFEAARQLGGRARGVAVNGLALDNGPHLLLGAYRETLRLLEKVHPGPRPLLRLPLHLEIPGAFRLHLPSLPAPLHLAVGLLTARGVNWKERLAAARFMESLKRIRFRLEQDTTVDALLRLHGQHGAPSRHLWEPLCLAALNTPPAIASAQVFANVLRDSLAGSRDACDMLLPQTDFTALFPAPAADYVQRRGGEVRLSCPVRAISKEGSGYALTTDGGSEIFSHVVCAVPPQRLPALLAGLAELAVTVKTAAAFRYQPIYSVYLQYPPGTRLPQPLLGMAGGLGQWVFDRYWTHGQDGLMAVTLSGEGKHEGLEHGELAMKLARELAPLTGSAAPLWHRTVAEKRATFACTPHLSRPATETALPGLVLAGDYVEGDYPATLEGAVRSGVAAARRL